MKDRFKILFLGERNALRTQMAEAFLVERTGDDVRVISAGIAADGGELHPALRELMAEEGLSLEGHRVKSVKELRDLSPTPFDVVVTLSPRARLACSVEARASEGGDDLLPLFIGTPLRVHWRINAPSSDDSHESLIIARNEIRSHVDAFVDQGYLMALSTERRRAGVVLDAIEKGIIVHDERRRIYLFNSAAERITGRSREEVLGRNCHDIFPPDGICGSHCPFRTGKVEPFSRKDYQVAFTSADGTARLIKMHSSPVTTHQGRPIEVVAQISDVTEIDSLRWKLKQHHSLHGMVGNSSAMQGVFEIIRQVAASDYPVLINGESGTGKELAARAIHFESRRAQGPFVPINCGALPEHILESELFGHVRGAFTGAIRDKKGRFELANGGTIFLDEVGELTPAFQVKLLRVLQEQRFERVGGEQTIEVNLRVISATNRELRQMVRSREFREDLFYRLAVVPINLPPLRERSGDIPLLVNHIIEQIRNETSTDGLELSKEAMDLLLRYRWPGNVRELINALQFAAVRCPGKEIRADHLPPETRNELAPLAPQSHGTAAQDFIVPPQRSRKRLDIETVAAALAQAGGNKVQAAKLLGVGRATLYRFLNDNPISGAVRKNEDL